MQTRRDTQTAKEGGPQVLTLPSDFRVRDWDDDLRDIVERADLQMQHLEMLSRIGGHPHEAMFSLVCVSEVLRQGQPNLHRHHLQWIVVFNVACLGLTRSRGHLLKGGYDVEYGARHTSEAVAPALL